MLLDLDFRRTPAERLVDEQGPAPAPLDAGTRARLAETQGILILRRLRAGGVTLPAVLFADLDDAEQRAFLERTLAPLDRRRQPAGDRRDRSSAARDRRADRAGGLGRCRNRSASDAAES